MVIGSAIGNIGMPESPAPSVNSWLEDELYQQYLYDRQTVDAGWSQVFESNGHTAAAPPSNGMPEPSPEASQLLALAKASPSAGPGEHLVPLRGPALRIAENMEASLGIPVATSQRVMPVKVIDENRRLINQYRELAGKPKISYTQLVAWAIVRALEAVPALNQAYAERGTESFRVTRGRVNLGLAIDVAGKDGSRSLKVPSVKNAQALNFAEFLAAYEDLVARARGNHLTL